MHFSLSVRHLLALLILLLVTLPFITHYYLSQFLSDTYSQPSLNLYPNQDENDKIEDVNKSPYKFDESLLDNEEDGGDESECESVCVRVKDMKGRLRLMYDIRASVRSELRELEAKRSLLMNEMIVTSNKLDEIKNALIKKSTELERVHQALEQARVAQKEEESIVFKSGHLISPPLKLNLLPNEAQTLKNQVEVHSSASSWQNCDMHECFDYSRCSLASPFWVYYYYNPTHGAIHSQSQPLDDDDLTRQSIILDALNTNSHITLDPNIACLYLVILFNDHLNDNDNHKDIKSQIDSHLSSLPYWSHDGRNHLIVNLINGIDLNEIGVNVGKAMLAQSQFSIKHFRHKFDIISPVITITHDIGVKQDNQILQHCPARRKYLASFQAADHDFNHQENNYYSRIKSSLISLSESLMSNQFKFNYKACMMSESTPSSTSSSCAMNLTMLEKQSTFSLLIPHNHLYTSKLNSHSQLSIDLHRMLSEGTIPVLIGSQNIKLPFDEVIDWHRALVQIPLARITELHYILSSFTDSDIIDMRRQGQLYLERYLSSPKAILDTILAIVRHERLAIPAPAAMEVTGIHLYNNTLPLMDANGNLVNVLETDDEILGPIESPFSSLTYQRNYSLVLTHSYHVWNTHYLHPFTNYPSTPYDPILPSEAKFIGSSYGFRPIAGGSGGAGKEFSEAIGGNMPREQFTIVMLTYERETILLDSLSRLKAIPHLNKVIVVWNSPSTAPSSDLKWPDIGVPIQVFRSKRNSLNNRFLPYKEIETDAVLSLDDDAHLRHDEIVFGFRVWREARDRIVGFPGRFHAWDSLNNNWQYNSNYSCELSMVLTGAAFYHKYYSYLYTYSMPKAIRDKVDEYMNCEDIAMNFLVSHISRQPPIKVTSRWTFRCPGCPVSLSEDDSHFQERHRCLNYFASVYGYMPLLYSQFRADSVLFKTRIPHDKQKCFKFI